VIFGNVVFTDLLWGVFSTVLYTAVIMVENEGVQYIDNSVVF